MENHTNNCKDIQDDSDNMDNVAVVTLDNEMEFNVSFEEFTYPANQKINLGKKSHNSYI